jgi:uncharacterized membrane protein
MQSFPLSKDRGLVASALVSVAGAIVAAYLTLVHYRSELLVCGVTSGCKTVQSSSYSTLFGVPVALFGLLMYLFMFGLAVVRLSRPESRPLLTIAAFSVTTTGVMYAAYLTYVELWVIDALCQWCVASAILTLVLWIIEGFLGWRLLMLDPPVIEEAERGTIQRIVQ